MDATVYFVAFASVSELNFLNLHDTCLNFSLLLEVLVPLLEFDLASIIDFELFNFLMYSRPLRPTKSYSVPISIGHLASIVNFAFLWSNFEQVVRNSHYLRQILMLHFQNNFLHSLQVHLPHYL
jgi:hypothetical protein